MEDFRTFFEQDYQGVNAFVEKIVSPVFGKLFMEATEDILQSNPIYKPAADRANILSIKRFGACEELDVPLYFFDITLSETVRLVYSRVNIQALVRQLMETHSAALIVFHYPDNKGDWRVSYVSKGSNATDATSAKRYTYLMGENQKCRTAADRFAILANKEKNVASITDAFSVEALTKLFYKELFDWYEWALSENDGFEVTYPNDTSTETDDRKIDEHIIRLITRLMFVWFIKQKKLVPEKIFNTNELKNILKEFDPKSKKSGNYYNAILQNLFFATLNKPIKERQFATDENYHGIDKHYGIKTLFRDAKEGSWFRMTKEEIIELFKVVPFLNGGLFECLDKENADGKIMYYDGFSRAAGKQKRAYLPNCLFFDHEKGLIPLLEKFNFTVEENTPSDVEVALDPELLGKVFENLLGAFNPETKETARNQSGSFYTPREIVNYMVDESLIAFLTNTCVEIDADTIRKLFTQDTLPEELKQSPENCKKLIAAIKAAKMLDPACGSGAFPMGMLNKMLEILYKLLPTESSNYDTKLHLIQNCIYGLDIQTIAVQITKLRFFISLICEQTPSDNVNDNYGIIALPNLETKFVAANTLIGLKKDFSDKLDLQNEELKQMKMDLLDIRRNHFMAGKADIKLKLREEDEKLRNKIKAFLIESSSKPDELKIGYWKKEIENLKLQRSNFEGEKWEDTSIKPQLQVSLDLGFEPIPETQPSIFKVDINKQKRDEIDLNIKRLENEIRKEENKTQIDGFEDEAQKLSHWNPYNQNISSNFFDPEWMFGIKGGFDLVIGNPPYIKEYTYKNAFEEVRTSNYYQGKMDLWYLFACQSIDFLNNTGHLCFIATNNWVTNAGASKMRNKVISDTKIIQLVDFGNFMIFESASIQTMVMIFEKNKDEDNYCFDFRKLFGNTTKSDSIDLLNKELNNKAIYLLPTIIRNQNLNSLLTFNATSDESVLSKISENSIYFTVNEVANGIHPHYDFVNNKIAAKHGITVGNGIFGLSDLEKNNLDLSSNELELIKPYYTTEQVRKYITVPEHSLWLIYTDSSFKNPNSLNDYPNLKQHLDRFSEVITSDNKPYGLHRAREEKFFKGEKIIVQRKCVGHPSFSYADFDTYVSATFYVIKSDSINHKYLLGLLNSKLIEFWLKKKGKMQGDNFQLDKEPLLDIPIHKPSEKQQQKIINYVDQILISKKEYLQSDTRKLEQQIDNLVYKLYDLTYVEVKVVDSEFGMSEEDYSYLKIE